MTSMAFNKLGLGMVVLAFAVAGTGCGKKAKADLETILNALESVGNSKAKPTSPKSALGAHSSSRNVRTVALTDFPESPSMGGNETVEFFGQPCQARQSMDSSSSLAGGKLFEISGSECPIEFWISAEQSGPNSGYFSIRYLAKSDEARRAADVDDLTWKMTVKADSSGRSGSVRLELSANSRKHGKVTYDLTGTQTTGSDGTVRVVIEGEIGADDKVAEVKATLEEGNGRETSEITINGEKLTEEQVRRADSAFSMDLN